MKRYVNKATVILALGMMWGCSGDDYDDSDTVAALERQNEILERNNQQQTNSVTVFGKLDFLDSDQTSDATVKLKTGSIWTSAIDTNGEDFEIKGVEPNSDFLLLVESPSDAFLPRAMFGKSRANPAGSVYQDIGPIGVSEGVERSFSVLDQESGEPVAGLVFRGTSSIGIGTGVEDYLHESTFDAATGLYSITLPQSIPLTLYADLDINKDGKDEYERYYDYYKASSQKSETPTLSQHSYEEWGYYLDLGSFSISSLALEGNGPAIFLLSKIEPPELNNVELRISVVDEDINQIPGLTLAIVDSINGSIESSYDATSQQYVLNAQFEDSLRVMLPAFTQEVDGQKVNYASSTIGLRLSNDNMIEINTTSGYYELPYNDAPLNLVISPRPMDPSLSLRVVEASEQVDDDFNYKIFYSTPIALTALSGQLVQEDVVTITRGNASNNDLVLPGTTLVSAQDIAIGVTAQLAVSDTLLTLSPQNPLAEGKRFTYRVGDVIEKASGIAVDLYDDEIFFQTPITDEFSISDIVLDNFNFTTNGAVIVSSNTAGISSNPIDYDRDVRLLIPQSATTLKSLTLSKRLVTDGDVLSEDIETFEVVRNGVVYYGSFTMAITAAQNENVSSNISVIEGSALAEGSYWYSFYLYESMSDNTASEVNTIAFDYALERQNGVIEAGSITLPVR